MGGLNTGTVRWPGTDQYPGTSVYPGQGNLPLLEVAISYSDTTDPTPAWANIHPTDVRSFGCHRGRGHERSEFEAGTADLVLDNRDRAFDPLHNVSNRPGNRVKAQAAFNSEKWDLFTGYVEEWDQEWPEGMDAIAIARCSDEITMLNRRSLPAMDPASAQSYEDMVKLQEPTGYWRMDDSAQGAQALPAVGSLALYSVVDDDLTANSADQPILGDLGGYFSLAGGNILSTSALDPGDPTDPAGGQEFTLSCWFRVQPVPAANRFILTGPTLNYGASDAVSYSLYVNSFGQVIGEARNGSGNVSVNGGAITNTWYFAVLTITGGNLRLYLNGTQVASSAWIGTFSAVQSSPEGSFEVNDPAATHVLGIDEIWHSRKGTTAARVIALWQAATARGFTFNIPGKRVNNILDAIQNTAPRSVETSWPTPMLPTYMHGQNALSELKEALRACGVTPMLFVNGAGEIVFYHERTPGVAADIFGDASGELPYEELEPDYSDAFLVNKWIGSARPHSGNRTPVVYTAADAASIEDYGERSQTLDDIPVNADADVVTMLDDLLALTLAPRYRIVRISFPIASSEVGAVAFNYEIGSTARVKRTPPGGGSRIDQTSIIQSVDYEIVSTAFWKATWEISSVPQAV